MKTITQIQKSFSDNSNFRLGLSLGAIFFAMENFALEIHYQKIDCL